MLDTISKQIKWRLTLLTSWLKENEQKKFDNKKYWSARAKQYGKRSVINVGYSDEKFDQIKERDKSQTFPHLQRLLSSNEKIILDFGCGSGRFTADLASLINGKAIGVDATAELIALTKDTENVTYKVLKKGTIPLSDQSVDVIWVYSVLGCIKGDDLTKTIGELNRVLKKGGLLFVSDNTTEKENIAHYTYRGPSEYQKLLNFVSLSHIQDYLDEGEGFKERFSVMAGRKNG